MAQALTSRTARGGRLHFRLGALGGWAAQPRRVGATVGWVRPSSALVVGEGRSWVGSSGLASRASVAGPQGRVRTDWPGSAPRWSVGGASLTDLGPPRVDHAHGAALCLAGSGPVRLQPDKRKRPKPAWGRPIFDTWSRAGAPPATAPLPSSELARGRRQRRWSIRAMNTGAKIRRARSSGLGHG